MRMRKPYHYAFTKKFNGLGVLLVMDPPYAVIRRSFSFEIRLGWFLFWYIKEKK
jgi:hypothetical protein